MKNRNVLLTVGLLSSLLANAQTFTNVMSSSGLPVDRTILWGFIDYNGDGFEDLLASTGSSNTFVLKLFKNNGNLTFSDVSTNIGLPEIDSLRYGHVADFNKDGKQDFILVDYSNNLQVFCASTLVLSKIKQQNQAFHFRVVPHPKVFRLLILIKMGFQI